MIPFLFACATPTEPPRTDLVDPPPLEKTVEEPIVEGEVIEFKNPKKTDPMWDSPVVDQIKEAINSR
tara:strand:- start:1791 stop:1991 length:201 start_codon:yes stop_codon:yes gene_type:complete